MPPNASSNAGDPSLESTLDCRLAEAAERRLRESPFTALRSLECHCRNGELCVRGKVPTFYVRQVAVDSLRKIHGVACVLDEIEVADDP